MSRWTTIPFPETESKPQSRANWQRPLTRLPAYKATKR